MKVLLKDYQGVNGRPLYLNDLLNILSDVGLIEDIKNDKGEIIGFCRSKCCCAFKKI